MRHILSDAITLAALLIAFYGLYIGLDALFVPDFNSIVSHGVSQ